MATETIPSFGRETIPIDDARECSGALFEVLALIHAAVDLSENGPCLPDKAGVTDEKTRITSLLTMARDKTVLAIETLKV